MDKELVNKVLAFLKGKKSYIIAIAMVGLGLAQGLDIFIVPEWMWGIIGALGLGALRAGVTKVADEIKAAANKPVE